MRKFFIVLFSVTAMLLLFGTAVSADNAAVTSGFCGDGEYIYNLYWEFNEETATLSVSGEGKMADYSYDVHAPWYGIQNRIRHVKIEDGVTELGSCAFHHSEALETVSLPEGITDIPNDFLAYCDSLTTVNIPSTVTVIDTSAFHGSANLQGVILPDGLKYIGRYAFDGTNAFEGKLIIPESVVYIGCYAFRHCYFLRDVTVENPRALLEDGIFIGVNPEIILRGAYGSSIHLYALDNYYQFTCTDKTVFDEDGYIRGNFDGTDITWFIKDDVLTISGNGELPNMYVGGYYYPNIISQLPPWYFRSEYISSVVIEEGITRIGKYAFYGCDITSVDFPTTLNSIGAYAFAYTYVEKITIPSAVSLIEEYAFLDCRMLENVRLLSPNTVILEGAFYYNGDKTLIRGESGSTAEAYAIANGHEFSSDDAEVVGNCGESLNWKFNIKTGILTVYGSGKMKNYTSNVATVNPPWYKYCDDITGIVLEEGITYIGANTFTCCGKVKELSLPASVELISSLPSTALEKITVHPDNKYYEADEYGVLYRKGFTKLVRFPQMLKLKSYTVPDCTTYIYQAAFSGAKYLEHVDIGDGVLTIDHNAFWDCPNLRSVRIGDSVKIIEYAAFFLCGKLTSVTMGNSVIYINNAAFEHTGLTSIVIPASVEKIADAFYGTPLKHIYVMNPDMYFYDDALRNTHKNTVVHGYAGSTAEHYAKNQKYSFVQLLPFTDVPVAAPYYEAVGTVTKAGLFNGVSATEFAPDSPMTRAMFVTVLARLDKADTSPYAVPVFSDVKSGEWYTESIGWAAANGIVNGVGDGTFDASGEITVEQALTVLARYASFKKSEDYTVKKNFADIDEVSDWARDGVLWAANNGVYLGNNGKLSPKAPATRYMLAEIFANYMNIFNL